MRFLLDTVVVSELRKRRMNPAVQAWSDALPDEDLAISVISLGEIRAGAVRVRPANPQFADELDRWLTKLELGFADRILNVTGEVAHRWGGLRAAHPAISPIDLLIAATALVHDLTVATRNLRDFQPTGVACVDPFA